MDPYLSPQLGGLGGDGMGPVLGNPNMLAQAIAARRQPRPQLSGPATGAELAQNLGMVPGLGLLGVGGDIAQYIDKPETRGWLPYALTAAGAIPFLGALAKMAGPLPKGILKSQAGAIAYHGSPHKFDSFDASKIGTGEGAQAYGHGVYLAENPSVARQYQKQTSADGFLAGGKVFDPHQELKHLNVKVPAYSGDLDGAIQKAREIASSSSPSANLAAQDLAKLESIKASGGLQKNTGNLYKADIPDEWIPKMLDWDLPVSKQPEAARAVLEQFDKRTSLARGIGKDSAGDIVAASNRLGYKIEEALQRAGIPGIRYLDQGSRLSGELKITPPHQTVAGDWMVKGNDYSAKGVHFKTEMEALAYLNANQAKKTSNYVVFPGMEKQVKILSRE